MNDISGKLIALVDDDPAIISTVTDYFGRAGVKVRGFLNAEDFFKFLHTQRPDLIILDIVLPDMNGFQVCKNLRETEQFSKIPIIILSGQTKDADKVFGLDLGADDYLGKPYSPDELLARVKAVLRRKETEAGEERIKIGDAVEIDLKRYQVNIEGRSAKLTPTEFKIVKLLASRKGHVFTREKILRHLWGEEKVVVERTVDVHIRHLRRKLGKYADLIKMVRGVGYMLEQDT